MSTKVIQFEKSHAINHLLVYISQQIFSPIISSKQSLTQMTEDANLSPGQSFYLSQALNELNQAEHSLKDYMTIMDPQHNNQNSIKLTKMIQETVQMIHPFASLHNVELQFLSTAENDLTLKDYSLLRFALLNLIKNGVEACGPGGRVDVFLHELIDQFYILIEDNGPGLSADVLSHLGQPLHSGKEDGTGLGIAVAYKITESLGGKIEVDSKKGTGTTFNLYFPKKNFIIDDRKKQVFSNK